MNRGIFTVSAVAIAASFALPARAGGRDGDVLRVFDRAYVLVQTNEEPALARRLVEGRQPRILRVAELDSPIDDAEVVVRLENRLYRNVRRANESASGGSAADSLRIGSKRIGRRGWEISISAPDGPNLRRAVEAFRRLREQPTTTLTQRVSSLAVVTIGDCDAASRGFLALDGAHAVDVVDYARANRGGMDEILLIDRSAPANEANASGFALLENRGVGSAETVAWRERKPDGGFRTVLSGPNGDAITNASRQLIDIATLSETPRVLARATDLRSVRRVAVTAIVANRPELARQLGAKAASALRATDSFEVLERAQLGEVLAEIALGQAGITKGADRARLRQLAAADALLILDVDSCAGASTTRATYERVTPKLGNAPSRPPEPSRMRVDIGGDSLSRTVAEALLGKTIGYRTRREYDDAIDDYRYRTLPSWERQVRDWQSARRFRAVAWRETSLTRGSVQLRGSARLVDLNDGTVLWEAPIALDDMAELPGATRTVTVQGEDTVPARSGDSGREGDAPEPLLARALSSLSDQAVNLLRSGAILPKIVAAQPETASVSGKLIDIDGEALLVGLGSADGVRAGDTLFLRLSDGATVRILVTRVRPRTSDAVFDAAVPSSLKVKAAIGGVVEVRK